MMRWLLIDRLNAEVDRCGDIAEFVAHMESLGGQYVKDAGHLDSLPGSRHVFFANHPLGGADVIAAIGLLESEGTSYKIFATNTIRPPTILSDHVVVVDNSDLKTTANIAPLRNLINHVNNRSANIFVFPAGHCAVFHFRTGVSDYEWKDTFLKLAVIIDACLVPIWFSGRNSLMFYAIGYFIGRLRSLGLPREFFSTNPSRLIFRIGRPIEPQCLPFFGDQQVQAMRASVYLLKARAPTADVARKDVRSGRNGRAKRTAGTVSAHLLPHSDLQPEVLAELRRKCGLEYSLSWLDRAARHVLIYQDGVCVGACRLLDWSLYEDSHLTGETGLSAVFDTSDLRLNSKNILEFDRVAIDPSANGLDVMNHLLVRVREAADDLREDVLCAGVIVLDDCDTVLADAQFEFVRRQSPCTRTAGMRPRTPLVPPSRDYDFNARRIRYVTTPSSEALSGVLRLSLGLGMRFGPSAFGAAVGDLPCVVGTLPSGAKI